MALRTKLAKKVLTKKEQKHLTESGIYTMAHIKNQKDFMDKQIAERKDGHAFVCLDCRHIIFKLEEAGVKF